LRNFGSTIPPSRRTSTNGGGRNYQNKGHECSNYTRNSSTLKKKLKEWNMEVFGNINQWKKSIEDRKRKL
jgi:hypothetical protein